MPEYFGKKKLNKWTDGRTDVRTDGQTDNGDSSSTDFEKKNVHSSCLILTSIFENFEHYTKSIAEKQHKRQLKSYYV